MACTKIDVLRLRTGDDAGEETFDLIVRSADPTEIREFRQTRLGDRSVRYARQT